MAEAENLRTVHVPDLLNASSQEDLSVQLLRDACCETGFFLVTGHSLPQDLLDKMFAMSKNFFELPEEEKLRFTSSERTGWRGFNPYGSGQNCSLAVKRPELKETFYCGQPPAESEGLAEPLPGFYSQLRSFHGALLELSRALLRGLSLALGLAPGHLADLAFTAPVAKVLMAFYPPAHEGDLSCGAHTDCGFLTLVCQDSSETQGLQVKKPDGTWLSVKTDRYTPVANLGDLAQRWTNDLFRSSWHRVRNVSSSPRFSLVFFNNMDEDAEVECLPSCESAERPKKYAKTTCGEYVASKMKEMRSHLSKEQV
ncbi:unnamed protein product [Effrenium voratum]|nr:unnamed protein product [Effrenium voratum]